MLDQISHAFTTLCTMTEGQTTVIIFDASHNGHDDRTCAQKVALKDRNEMPRYYTRFGDECCAWCNSTLRWSPQWVRDGIYGDDTDAWTASTLDMFVARFNRTLTAEFA